MKKNLYKYTLLVFFFSLNVKIKFTLGPLRINWWSIR